ncbi:MAG: hypothetical protein DRP87_12515 [Spirochaetes bacterium]|nr:MAG: hypothetical protein DRP87_12515 [Spirochaetota bacterium]
MMRTLRAASSALKDCHPLSVRRFAPTIKRMQRRVRLKSKLTAALPLIRSAVIQAKCINDRGILLSRKSLPDFSSFKQRVQHVESSLNTVEEYIRKLKDKPNLIKEGVLTKKQERTKLDKDGKILYASEVFLNVLGYPPSEVENKNILDFIPGYMQEYFTGHWREAVRFLSGRESGFERIIRVNVVHKRGYEIPLRIKISSSHDKEDFFFMTMKDMSCREEIEKELDASRQNYRILAETTSDAIIQIIDEFKVIFANSAVKNIFGYESTEVENQNIGMLFPESRYNNYVRLFEKYFFIDNPHRKITGLQNTIEVLGKRKDGELIPLEISFGNSIGVGEHRILTCIIRDIALRKKVERRLKYLAYHDKLTSLGNRDRLSESLDQTLAEIKRQADRHAALLFMDLDGFKKVNDSLGHEIGDIILKECASRLVSSLRQDDQVYRLQIEHIFRLGGDEFIVLLPYIKKPEDSGIVARRIIERILEPFAVKGYGSLTNINMGVSIGIALIPEDGMDKTTLLRNADAAMYQAKKMGNSYMFFTREMNNRAIERLMLEEGLRKAVGTRDFELHYQPIVDSRQEIKGVEALIRWIHPERGVLTPEKFIPIAEDTRLIHPIGKWVLETACRQLKRLHELGFEGIYVSVNISPKQLEKGDLKETVKGVLEKVKLEAKYLTLELTETTIMDDPELAISKMFELEKYNRGIKIAIDDFGTGYSSLSYLSRFPVQHLKIDKSFVGNMKAANNIKIINAILSLGHNLGLNIIAEGVEEKEQFEYLVSKNCNAFQGYFFKKPLAFDEISDYLKHRLSGRRL